MSDHPVYHVIPAENGWKVTEEGSGKVRAETDTKREALIRAREIAKSKKPSQIRVHKRDGKIQIEYTYRHDPERFPG